MKKILSVLIALTLCMGLMLPMVASAETDVAKVIAEAQNMTWDELLAKAAECVAGDDRVVSYCKSPEFSLDGFLRGDHLK